MKLNTERLFHDTQIFYPQNHQWVLQSKLQTLLFWSLFIPLIFCILITAYQGHPQASNPTVFCVWNVFLLCLQMHQKQHIIHSLPTATVAYIYLLKKLKLCYIPNQFSCLLAVFTFLTPDSLRVLSCWPVSSYFLQRCTHVNTLKPWVSVWNKYSQNNSFWLWVKVCLLYVSLCECEKARILSYSIWLQCPMADAVYAP